MKKTLKTVTACGILLGSVLALLACGDDVTKVYRTTDEDSDLKVAESIFSLGRCDSASIGEMRFVQDEYVVYLCANTGWTPLSGSKSCAAEPLFDNTGYRIVCGGDSVGIVLNSKDGEDGKDGNDGANGTSCTVAALSNGTGYKIVCGGDSVGVILNGSDGKDGENGKDGNDGANGTSCIESALSDGTGYKTVCVGDSDGKSSSSAASSSSSVEKYDNPEIFYGTLTDERDNRTYRTVVIGSQTWMAENLNYAYPKESAAATDSLSFCYNNDPANCTTYGRLYTWAAAMDACPDGWYLPSNDEWDALETYVSANSSGGVGYALKATSGWEDDGNGTDAFGFGALPAGYSYISGTFTLMLGYTAFWSSTEYDGEAYCRYVESQTTSLGTRTSYKDGARSVRCLKK